MLPNHPISEKLYLKMTLMNQVRCQKEHKMQNEQQGGETVRLWILSQAGELVLHHG